MATVRHLEDKLMALRRARAVIRASVQGHPGTDQRSEGTRICLLLEEIDGDLEAAERDARLAKNGLQVVRQ